MMDTDIEKQALTDHELYDSIIAHRESYQRIPWVKYETLNHQTVTFIPPEAINDLYKKDYQTMQEQMIYGAAIPFDQLIEKLKQLQEKFRNKMSKGG